MQRKGKNTEYNARVVINVDWNMLFVLLGVLVGLVVLPIIGAVGMRGLGIEYSQLGGFIMADKNGTLGVPLEPLLYFCYLMAGVLFSFAILVAFAIIAVLVIPDIRKEMTPWEG